MYITPSICFTWQVKDREKVTSMISVQYGNETLTSNSGFTMVGTLLKQTDLSARADKIEFPECVNPAIPNSSVLTSMIALLSAGKHEFDAIEDFRKDPFFTRALGIAVCPSSSTLRQRLDLGAKTFIQIADECSIQLLERLSPDYGKLQTSQGDMIPIDADVSCHDNSGTKKEGLSYTYKGHDGFSNMYSYIGKHGFFLGCEFREGRAHSQKGTPAFLRQILTDAHRLTTTALLLRMDSGNDSLDNLGICFEYDTHFVIKRNLRREKTDPWINLAKAEGKQESPRNGKIIFRGSTYRTLTFEMTREGKSEQVTRSVRVVYEVVERTIKHEKPLLFPDYEVSTWWTDLTVPEEEVIALYCNHGTSEQFHSEIKSDMNLERFPSGKFATNALILSLAKIAFNVLRICGQKSIEVLDLLDPATSGKKVERRRLRTVIQDIICLAGRVIRSSRILRLSLGKQTPLNEVWMAVYNSFLSLPKRI